MPRLTDLLAADPIDLAAVSTHLDSLDSPERVTQVREVPGSQQKRLFASARGWRALSQEYYVPSDHPTRKFVRHLGKNSLPVFSHFEKRFARPEADSRVLWGYNHGPVMGLVGPGHFVMRDGPEEGEVHVDYYSLPAESIDGAPPLKANDSGISTLVYGNMIDVLRGVSEHVSIGRAIKHGKDTPNYFLLCREA